MNVRHPNRHRSCGHTTRTRSGLWVCCAPFLHEAGRHFFRKASR